MKIESKPLRYAHAEGHTDVCYSEDGHHILTCGRDGDVRIWVDIEDDDPNSHCVGESAVAVCFKDKRLYVASDNHAVQAYTFPAFDKDGIVTRFTAPVTQIMTTSKIEVLGCASENMEAKICSQEGGAPLFVMTDHKGPVLSIAICPKMKYTCTACGDGVLRVWDIDTQKIVKEVSCVPKINTFFAAKVLCRVDFEPSEGKYLAYPNNREVVILECDSWSQRMNFTNNLIKCAISQCLFSPCGQYLAGSTIAGQIAIWQVQLGNCIDIVEHPTSHNVSAMAWNPKGNGILVYCDVAGQLGMLLNCYGEDSKKSEEANEDDAVEAADDEILDNLIENYESDDDNAISLERIKNSTMGLVTDDVESRGPSRLEVPPARTVQPQPPFQPSATPASLEHRYMCWNDVGIVRCHTNANGESTIDVEFHDTNVHHGIHLNNYLNHTMASLSSTVLALACETPSKLVCISLVGSSKEWSVSLPDTEEAVCVGAARGAVALATSARLLRLYTPMGTQRQVISLAGPIVTLAAYNTSILAAYHSSEPGLDDQHISMDIIAMNGRQVRCKTVRVPLTPGSKLSWLGASDAGSPCVHDSAGALRLHDVSSGVWLPICDTNNHSKGASDNWFIVSVSEPTQAVRAILCRGTSYPLTVPKPIISELPIQIPLCELDTEKGQYEEQLVRWAHTTSDVDVKAARETALKLFALACRSEVEQRALELMELLKDDRLLPLAAKYASRLGRMHLADKLTSLAETWETDADRSEQSYYESEVDEPIPIPELKKIVKTPVKRKTTVDKSTSLPKKKPAADTSKAAKRSASEATPTATSRLNVAQNSHFTELDTQETYDVTNTEDLNTSLILPMKTKEKKEVAPIKPVPIKCSPGGVKNPFKKQKESSKNVQSPLSLTDRNLVQSQSIDTEENSDPLKPIEGETFLDWFSRNKTTLEQQNPDLTPSELNRHCVRTFRGLQNKVTSTDSNKRKLDDSTNGVDTPVTSASKQSKLSAFAFSKS